MKNLNEFFTESIQDNNQINEGLIENITYLNQDDTTAVVMPKKVFQDWKSGAVKMFWGGEYSDFEKLGIDFEERWHNTDNGPMFVSTKDIKGNLKGSNTWTAYKYNEYIKDINCKCSKPVDIQGTDLVLILMSNM